MNCNYRNKMNHSLHCYITKIFLIFSHIIRWMKQVFSYRKNMSELDLSSKESSKMNFDHWSDEVAPSKSESRTNELKQRLFPTQSSTNKASLQRKCLVLRVDICFVASIIFYDKSMPYFRTKSSIFFREYVVFNSIHYQLFFKHTVILDYN